MLSERPGNSPSTAVAVVDGLVLETPRRRLVDGARFSLRRVRAALVGRNGSGKTTLLEVLAAHRAGRPVPSHVSVRGSISWAPGTTCGHLPQHPSHLEEAPTVGEYLDSRAGEIGRLHRCLRALLDQEGALSGPGGLDEYGDVVERLTALDAWDLPERRIRSWPGWTSALRSWTARCAP